MDINIKDLMPEQLDELEAQIAELRKAKEHKLLCPFCSAKVVSE